MLLGETLVRNSGVPAREVGLALASQKKAQDPAGAVGIKETVKVEADRLDRLLDAIGELVIAETMIFQSPEIKSLRSPIVAKQLVSLDKITRELQKMGTSLRMVPIRPVFQKMAKLARDLARKAGKSVEFQCTGDETELDKTVVDKIGDPLVHMVRNSIDHGIERDPEARMSAGKPPQAKVVIRAFQKGGNVCIRIEDDGKGLDREAILRKARERGMPGSDAPDLPDQDVWNFIFEPGFSTAAQVTEISGRGVGMDVVRRNIGELRGRIEIESETGKGTAFIIWLPLTLAIIDGMIVRVGGQRLVFPTLSILRIIPVRPEDTRAFLERGEMLLLQGEAIPLFDLAAYVPGCAPEPDGRALAVIVECGSRKAGLLVAELLGQQQVVIKGLGEALKLIPGVSGGAILSDGTVGMILDVDGLLANLKTAPASA
jgi:two-component system chemotaxis sensor kinase CheA